MTHNMADSYRYGFKLNLKTPANQANARTSNLLVVFKAPNGFTDVVRSNGISLPGKGSTWSYTFLGDNFFKNLLDMTGSIPTG